MNSETELELDHEIIATPYDQDIELRASVVSVLQIKLGKLPTGSEGDRERGKLQRMIDAIDRGDEGWETQHGVKGIIKDIRETKKRIERAQRQHDAAMGIDELIKEYNFHVKSSGSGGWWYQPLHTNEFGIRPWVSIKKEALLMSFPQLNEVISVGEGMPPYRAVQDFNTKLVDQGRRVDRVVMSHSNTPNCLNIMPRERCQGAEDGATNYHWIFDAIFESLSGGHIGTKNFEALQKTIWAKYLHQENTYIPNIVIGDKQGRGGKGLFANTFLRRLFMGNIADNCSMNHVLGKFNAVVAGKAVIIVNETNRKKMEEEATKAFLGSPTIIIEPKGQDAYSADNTALVIFVTNDTQGGVNVSGTKSDNRFSFFNVSETIYSAVRRWVKLTTDEDWTELEAKQWIESSSFDSGQNLLRDEYEMGKWINAMQERYGDVTHIEPHHDEEYARIINQQRGAWTQTVDAVFSDPDFDYIRWQVLEDLVRSVNKGEMLPGKKRMREEIERLCVDRNYPVEFVERCGITDGKRTVQRTVWRSTTAVSKTFNVASEDKYGHVDQHSNRWIWVWQS